MPETNSLVISIGSQKQEDGTYKGVVGWTIDGNASEPYFSDTTYPTETEALAAAEYFAGMSMRICTTMGFDFDVKQDISYN